jgi:hypothetical protein
MPDRWLVDCISALGPVPLFDAKLFDIDHRREVAVVQVEPIAVPPEHDGRRGGFQRVSGETVPVSVVLAARRESGRGGRTGVACGPSGSVSPEDVGLRDEEPGVLKDAVAA